MKLSPMPWILWAPAFPPLNSGEDAGSTAMILMAGSFSFRYLPVLESLTADDLFRRTFEHYLAATGATETVADVRHDLVLQLLFG